MKGKDICSRNGLKHEEMVRVVTKTFFEVTGPFFSGVTGSTCFGVTRLRFFRGYRGSSKYTLIQSYTCSCVFVSATDVIFAMSPGKEERTVDPGVEGTGWEHPVPQIPMD